jgi:signal transduction histidine kinase
MVVTNFITFASYLTICGVLLVLARKTGRVVARDWRYFVVGFALFIVACGSTHLLEVITTWTPIFWVDAWTNVLTAALSAWVAVMLLRRARTIGFGINDYAARLASTETEKQQMEASLLAAQKLEDWSRMSAVVAHEIGNPLETIQNLLHLIRTTPGISGDVAEQSATATEEIARVITITRSTMGFFRQASVPEAVDLAAGVQSVRYLLDTVLRIRGIELDVQSSGNLVVEAFPGEARQVLLNLIRNACEATPQDPARGGSKVWVTLTGEREGVRVIIADHGMGIDPAHLPNLFQFGKSTKGEHGNGMGLWTVRQILRKHGGEVAVESRVGEGTRFLLFWPRHYVGVAGEELVAAHPGQRSIPFKDPRYE